ncbi:MAG: DUF6600 domain-containing protein [Hyphomicrobiales bacterium]
MNLKTLFASTALATVSLTAPVAFTLVPAIPSAEAAANVSISVFYDQLGNDGDWTDYNGQTVFVPANVGTDWRPYTVGHWEYADRYGWTWVSEEPFGWATYHYGRWGYAQDIGWYWVPGTRWAPAWVSWKRSRDHVVWAPLPPSTVNQVSVNISDSEISDVAWVAVPTRQFLVPNVSTAVVAYDQPEYRTIVHEARPIGAVRVENNIVVNNVLEVNQVEKFTGQQVEKVKIRTVDDPRQAAENRGGVVAYTGKLQEDTNAKPQKVTDLEKVKQRRAERSSGQNEQTNGSTGTSTGSSGNNGQTGTNGQATTQTNGQTGKSATTGTSRTSGNSATTGEADQGASNTTKKKTTGEAATGAGTDQSQGMNQGQGTETQGQVDETQSGKKNKKKEAQGQKKKKETTATPGEDNGQMNGQSGSQSNAAAENNTKKEKSKSAQGNEPGSGKKKKKIEENASSQGQGAGNANANAGQGAGAGETTGSTSKVKPTSQGSNGTAGNSGGGSVDTGKNKVIEQQGGGNAGGQGQ